MVEEKKSSKAETKEKEKEKEKEKMIPFFFPPTSVEDVH